MFIALAIIATMVLVFVLLTILVVVLSGKDNGLIKRLPMWDLDKLPLSIVIDESGFKNLKEIKSALSWSIAFWNKGVGSELFLPLGEIGKGAVVGVAKMNYSSDAIATAKFRLSPKGDISTANIYIREMKMEKLTLQRAVAHELGHILGLDHDNTAESVMYPTTLPTYPMLTSRDQELLKTIYG